MMMDILRSITGIDIFPVISLVLFVAIFGAVLVYAWRADAARMNRMAALPLDDTTGAASRSDAH
jgi:hypothetical protein